MKKLFILAIILIGCSNDEFEKCNCDLVIDAVTFQHQTELGVKYETVCVVENLCTNVIEQRNKISYTQNDIPVLGQCFK